MYVYCMYIYIYTHVIVYWDIYIYIHIHIYIIVQFIWDNELTYSPIIDNENHRILGYIDVWGYIGTYSP